MNLKETFKEAAKLGPGGVDKQLKKILDKGPAPSMADAEKLVKAINATGKVTLEAAKSGNTIDLRVDGLENKPAFSVGPNNIVWVVWQGKRTQPVGFVDDVVKGMASRIKIEHGYPVFTVEPKLDAWFLAKKIDPDNSAIPKDVIESKEKYATEALMNPRKAFEQVLKENPRTAFEEALGQGEQDFWLTPEDVADICLPCAQKMASMGIPKMRASVLFGQDLPKIAARWEDMPHGWDDASRKKFWESIGGSVTKCMEKIKDHVTDPAAFCASLKDRVTNSTNWRGPEKAASNPRTAFEEALKGVKIQ